MALKLKGSTSGFVGLDAPSVAGNNTLILPDSAGSAHQILANDITAGVTRLFIVICTPTIITAALTTITIMI